MSAPKRTYKIDQPSLPTASERRLSPLAAGFSMPWPSTRTARSPSAWDEFDWGSEYYARTAG
jgi:hypothetical protein